MHAVEVSYQAAWILHQQSSLTEAEHYYRRCIGFIPPVLGDDKPVAQRDTIEVKMRQLQAHYHLSLVLHSREDRYREAVEAYIRFIELSRICIERKWGEMSAQFGSSEAKEYLSGKSLNKAISYAYCNLAFARQQVYDHCAATESNLAHLQTTMLSDYEQAKDADSKNTNVSQVLTLSHTHLHVRVRSCAVLPALYLRYEGLRQHRFALE